MAELSLRQLRVFVSVAHSGNLGQSAEALFLTRGAVSQAIKALEQQLGVALFERRTQRLLLNSQGRQLLPLAEALLAQEQGVQALFHSGALQIPLRLGASTTIGNYLLPTLLAQHWPGEWPLPQVQLANSEHLQQALLQRELDLALVESESLHSELSRWPWREDEMVLIAPADHPLAGQSAAWSALEGQPWVLREPRSGSRAQFDHRVAPQLQRVQVVLELGQLEAVVRAVAAGLGLSLVSRLACQQAIAQGQVSELRLPETLVRRLYLVHPPSSDALPALQRLKGLWSGEQ
ncbi:DNA-binding transcriptional regulator, LysR family [Ferrimonas marina]|uniref:DNA-binding transcriptional regulator, LysR family n=1 Tax=Ferrimonas marina TaxID=299255 RepID=A0A1M5X2L5_9GAMM|nr:DNA-binding transcriptional regulator, LysR family [Ferrimonas marina]